LLVSAYVPPRIAIVPPSGTTFTAFWIMASGWTSARVGFIAIERHSAIERPQSPHPGSAPGGRADALGATPAGVLRTATGHHRSNGKTHDGGVRERSIGRTLSDGHDMSMSVETHIIRMNRVDIEHVPTSISAWASGFARYR
jgi:hypothetical protein